MKKYILLFCLLLLFSIINIVALDIPEYWNYPRAPYIIKTYPDQNLYSNGEFIIKLKNLPNTLKIVYGNKVKGYNEEVLNVNECLFERNFICSKKVNLEDYDGMEIYYYFVLEKEDRILQSKPIKVKVDSKKPILELIDHSSEGIYNKFELKVEELNLKSINYFDEFGNQRWNNFCSKTTNGKCIVKKTFSKGNHKIIIKALDKAGNSESLLFEFFI